MRKLSSASAAAETCESTDYDQCTIEEIENPKVGCKRQRKETLYLAVVEYQNAEK